MKRLYLIFFPLIACAPYSGTFEGLPTVIIPVYCETLESGNLGFKCTDQKGYCTAEAKWDGDKCRIRICKEFTDREDILIHEKCHCFCEAKGEGSGHGDNCFKECERRKE